MPEKCFRINYHILIWCLSDLEFLLYLIKKEQNFIQLSFLYSRALQREIFIDLENLKSSHLRSFKQGTCYKMYDPFFDIFLYIKFEDVIVKKLLGSLYFAPSLLGPRILTGLGFTPNSFTFTFKLSKRNCNIDWIQSKTNW